MTPNLNFMLIRKLRLACLPPGSRRFASVAKGEPLSLENEPLYDDFVKKYDEAIQNTLKTMESRTEKGLIKNLDHDFFHEKRPLAQKIIKSNAAKVKSKISQLLLEKSYTSKIISPEDYFLPCKISLPHVLLDSMSNASPTRSFQELVEDSVYFDLKPLNLLHTYNQKSNSQNFADDTVTFKTIDITNPVEWFPEARKMKRKFIMHVGPTNSGKTYHALQKLMVAHKGYYAGPLRLLAREVFDKFQSQGTRCNLLTGEEVIPDLDHHGKRAGITSGTVEMISLNEEYDVVVLDEIQMISDENRGWAWTNVLLGAKAKEIHLCGEISSVPLVKRIVESTGDEIEINEYQRLGQLSVDEIPLKSLDDLRKGDCIVCFSKKNILDLKAYLEKMTHFKCGVIYGALPPDTRAHEALKFNNNEYDILIASDAIGMGLNLKINRVVFTSCEKFDGKQRRPLSASQVKQIGGRAGRYFAGKGSESVGRITATSQLVLKPVNVRVNAPIEYLKKACLWPPDSLWIKYYSMFPKGTKLFDVFSRFEKDLAVLRKRQEKQSNSSGANFNYFIADLSEMKRVSFLFLTNKLDATPKFLILDQFRLTHAPVRSPFSNPKPGSVEEELNYLLDHGVNSYLTNIISRSYKSILDYRSLPFELLKDDTERQGRKKATGKQNSGSPQKKYNTDNLKRLELFHSLVSLFLWMSYRYPKFFVDSESAFQVKNLIEYKISKNLENLRADKMQKGFQIFS